MAAKCAGARNSAPEANTVTNSDKVMRCLREKWFKDVKISGSYINALIDSGSDMSLIRASGYIKIGAPPLRGGEISFHGIGSDQNATLGQFIGLLFPMT